MKIEGQFTFVGVPIYLTAYNILFRMFRLISFDLPEHMPIAFKNSLENKISHCKLKIEGMIQKPQRILDLQINLIF